MTTIQIEGVKIGLHTVARGLDFAIQSIKDVQVIIAVFIEQIEKEQKKALEE